QVVRPDAARVVRGTEGRQLTDRRWVMEPRNARLIARIASESALLGGVAGAFLEAVVRAEPYPGLLFLGVWAAAAGLAVAATWWLASRRGRIAIRAPGAAMDLPAIAPSTM